MGNKNDYINGIFLLGNDSFANSPLVTYTIIDKVSNKVALVKSSFDFDTFFNTILIDLIDALHKFIKWVNSDNDVLGNLVINLSKEQLLCFKNHLSEQHYKLIEVALSGNKLIEKGNLRYRFDNFYNNEFICRILNEAIQEIEIINEQNLKITYTFFYEISNLIIRRRDYIDSELKMNYSKELKIIPYYKN
ncbi:hypothetical protein [Lysinibacillus capsici]|uniref:hypothetical protein n=1 Tax=Lysinibacillus capsici TaxID=2115968 RepID=UPI000E20ADEC|nr:hypothetical protein [Lysinibacillus capsici]RDV35229.1 hypothetical protein C7B89_01535 [Lysinibacillus capsici]